MAHVIRIGIGYNTFDFMEEGYGINLRPLSSFAAKVYADDPCERFKTRLFDTPEFGFIDDQHSAKMHKAISVIQFKLEGQLIEQYTRWNMDHRNVLKKVDFERGVYVHNGVEYPMLDTNFPTVDPDDPLRLSQEEEELVRSLEASFRNSEPLHRHIRFLYSNGSTYLSVNKNLLFHGCVPLKEDGSFQEVPVTGKQYYGRELFDELNAVIHDAYFQPEDSPKRERARDYMLYLWCGSLSPLFGKSQMSTFENFFVEDKELRREVYNPYFEHSANEDTCKMILENFGLDPETSRIINGHVPVKAKEGESPVKANGKLFVIDGGLAKAYQRRTGINGYTLIFNSHHLALAEHHDFEKIESDMGSYTPRVFIVQPMKHRLQEKHTDLGKEISARIQELRDLIEAFNRGEIKEK